MREWFRKKREYMAHRIFTICIGYLKRGPEAFAEMSSRTLASDEELDRLFSQCNLEIANDPMRRAFVREKVKAFRDGLTSQEDQPVPTTDPSRRAAKPGRNKQ